MLLVGAQSLSLFVHVLLSALYYKTKRFLYLIVWSYWSSLPLLFHSVFLHANVLDTATISCELKIVCRIAVVTLNCVLSSFYDLPTVTCHPLNSTTFPHLLFLSGPSKHSKYCKTKIYCDTWCACFIFCSIPIPRSLQTRLVQLAGYVYFNFLHLFHYQPFKTVEDSHLFFPCPRLDQVLSSSLLKWFSISRPLATCYLGLPIFPLSHLWFVFSVPATRIPCFAADLQQFLVPVCHLLGTHSICF